MDDRVPERRDSHASSSHEPSWEPTRSADLGKHSIFSHFPKDRNCEICQRTTITRALCRRRIGIVVPSAENFSDLITADHKVLSEGCESRNNHRYAVVVQDLATQGIQAYPCKTKTSQETQRSLQRFLEPDRKPKVIYTDNSLEFGKACEDLSWNHCTSTPHRSETNGIAERAVRRVKQGTSAVLLQSGLDENWWADSMECKTYLRKIQDILSHGKTPYERRFGEPFKGSIIPFGSLVEYHPITAKDQSNPSIWKESLTWIVPWIRSVRGGIWKGDIMVAGVEELETMDASEIYAKRLNAKEVIYPKEDGRFIFPVADGRKKSLEEIRNWQHPPWYGSTQFEENQKGLHLHNIFKTHIQMQVKHEMIFCPLQESRIDYYWNIDGSRDLSDSWTGFTQFTLLSEKHP